MWGWEERVGLGGEAGEEGVRWWGGCGKTFLISGCEYRCGWDWQEGLLLWEFGQEGAGWGEGICLL